MNKSNNSKISGFKKKEIDQLWSLLTSLDNLNALRSLAHIGKFSYAHALNVSKKTIFQETRLLTQV